MKMNKNLLLEQLEQLNDKDKEKYEKYWNVLAYNRKYSYERYFSR